MGDGFDVDFDELEQASGSIFVGGVEVGHCRFDGWRDGTSTFGFSVLGDAMADAVSVLGGRADAVEEQFRGVAVAMASSLQAYRDVDEAVADALQRLADRLVTGTH